MKKEKGNMLGMLSPKDLEWLDVLALRDWAFYYVELMGKKSETQLSSGWGRSRVLGGVCHLDISYFLDKPVTNYCSIPSSLCPEIGPSPLAWCTTCLRKQIHPGLRHTRGGM